MPKVLSRVIGRAGVQADVLASLEAMGYERDEAHLIIRKGRVLMRIDRAEYFQDGTTTLYLLDNTEESEENEDRLDRGYLVDLS
jgi:hypothetical protein